MARAMKKFSAGGAQGRYERRMADIEKDFKKDSAGKTGRAAEVLAAKREQRIADAKDDLAKRTGADRTATRKAEYDAEKNLTRTRKFGADKPAAKTEPAKTTAPAAAPAAEPAKAKPQTTREAFNAAFRAARNDPAAMKRGTFTFGGKSYTTKMAGEGPKRTVTANPVRTNNSAGTSSSSTSTSAAPAATVDKPKQTAPSSTPALVASNVSSNAMAILRAQRVAREKKEAEERKKRIGMPAHERMAKGGKVKKEKTMKYAKGGSTPPQPTAADRARSKKHLAELKKLKPTAEQAKVIASANRSEGPGYKKGGKMATKFGAAMKKKSADTKGRAMMKFAKGGSIDGCAVKGKTKTSMVKMKNGGSC
jgi:hypothetical protein